MDNPGCFRKRYQREAFESCFKNEDNIIKLGSSNCTTIFCSRIADRITKSQVHENIKLHCTAGT